MAPCSPHSTIRAVGPSSLPGTNAMSRSFETCDHVAYVVSRFPKLSETFILREMDGLERLGWRVSVFPFFRDKEAVQHPGVERWLKHLDKRTSALDILVANLAWL